MSTLHIQKRLNQQPSIRCAASECDGNGPERITIATGERGGPADYEFVTCCTWGCALVYTGARYHRAVLDALAK